MFTVFRNLFSHRGNKQVYLIVAALSLMVMMSAVAFAQTAVPPPTIDLDVTPLFESMNGYIPLFLGIFAIPGGIVIAIALVRMLINAVSSAIKGAAGKG